MFARYELTFVRAPRANTNLAPSNLTDRSFTQLLSTMAEEGRSRSSSGSSDGGPPEITLDALSADTLAALNAHLAVKDAEQVLYIAIKGLRSWSSCHCRYETPSVVWALLET